jgi:hypothetical protein
MELLLTSTLIDGWLAHWYLMGISGLFLRTGTPLSFIPGRSPGGMVEVCSVVQASKHTVHNHQGIINSIYSATTQNCCKSHKHDAENLFLVTRYY